MTRRLPVCVVVGGLHITYVSMARQLVSPRVAGSNAAVNHVFSSLLRNYITRSPFVRSKKWIFYQKFKGFLVGGFFSSKSAPLPMLLLKQVVFFQFFPKNRAEIFVFPEKPRKNSISLVKSLIVEKNNWTIFSLNEKVTDEICQFFHYLNSTKCKNAAFFEKLSAAL